MRHCANHLRFSGYTDNKPETPWSGDDNQTSWVLIDRATRVTSLPDAGAVGNVTVVPFPVVKPQPEAGLMVYVIAAWIKGKNEDALSALGEQFQGGVVKNPWPGPDPSHAVSARTP